MKIKVIDRRKHPEVTRQKELEELAQTILMGAACWDYRPGVGEFMKKYSQELMKMGMGELKAEHFNVHQFHILRMLGKK